MAGDFRNWIRAAAPWPARRFARRLAADLASLPRRVGRDRVPLPWRLLHDSGGGDYVGIGRALAAKILEATRASPASAVLDVGCGDGRVARHLAAWLASEGGYVGFDVSRSAVAFCRRTIGRDRLDFQFVHADVANGEYNPRGAVAAAGLSFPCADASRDLVIATSVFTHLRRDDAAAYLREIARVLKQDAVAYVTAYLVDAAAAARIAAGASPYPLSACGEGLWATDLRAPEAGAGFHEDLFLGLVRAAGLDVRELRRGTWSHGGDGWDHQDTLLLVRAAGPLDSPTADRMQRA